MRYRFIQLHRTVWPIDVQCHVLQVSRSGYYAWRRRPASATAQRRAELLERIRQIHERPYHNNYGAPRIHRELIAQGCKCNRKTVEKLMCQAGIRAATCRSFRVATTDSRHDLPIAPNRLARQFQPARPHQAWTMDITYCPRRPCAPRAAASPRRFATRIETPRRIPLPAIDDACWRVSWDLVFLRPAECPGIAAS